MLSRVLSKAFTTNYSGLNRWGIQHKNIVYNPSVAQIYELSIKSANPVDYYTPHSLVASSGALISYSGKRTGRSPNDKRIVQDENSKDIWFGPVNTPISPESNRFCRDLAVKYLNCRGTLYIVDGYVGWDPQYRLKTRILCSRPYHALFMKNMLIRPTEEELAKDFSDDNNIDFHIFNAGELHCPLPIAGVKTDTSIQINLTDKTQVILGTQYAGEMKKGLFGVMHYYMPKRGAVTLHASATEGEKGDVTLLFGLSGTGKTTLSADPKRKMLGDDEHLWSDNGVSNIEGGCYAKAINLSAETEPDIFNAIKFGAIMENVLFKQNAQEQRIVDFTNTSITENTRVSYPLEHIPNAKFPSLGGHAKNVIFLTCDAFGVLPPIARLTPGQTQYWFLSGYTAKVAGTEVGVKDPEPTFSACFGAAFLSLHPTVYSTMLAERMKQNNSRSWLINTGWSGGAFGTGKRMKLSLTRRIIDSVHDGSVEQAEWVKFPVFNFEIPTSLPGIPSEVLNPRNTWANKEAYDQALQRLGRDFAKNFAKYKDQAGPELREGGPC